MAKARVNGIDYLIPDGLSAGGAKDYLIQNEGFTPAELGLETIEPETGGLRGLPAEHGSASAAQAIGLGHLLTGERSEAADALAAKQPFATLFGQAIPFAAGGASTLGAMGIGGALEARQADSTGSSVLAGAGLAGAGNIAGGLAGNVLGRVLNAVKGATAGAATAVSRRLTGRSNQLDLPSGIRTTTGKVTGSRQLQQTEAALARNPVSSKPFQEIDLANEQLGRETLARYLHPNATPTELQRFGATNDLTNVVNRAVVDAVEAMDNAIPENALIAIPRPLQRKFDKLQSTSERGAFDFGPSDRVTGDELRTIISDLRAGARSSRAATRRNSREVLGSIDEVIRNTDGIDLDLWQRGSQQYGRWLKATNGKAISGADPNRINPTTLLNNLEKGNKTAVRSRGNISSGDPETDQLIEVMSDWQTVGSLTPDSGTPTGLALSTISGDVARTGGIGTLAAMGGSRLLQSPAGLGAVGGAGQSIPALTRTLRGAGAATAATTGQSLAELLREDEPDE